MAYLLRIRRVVAAFDGVLSPLSSPRLPLSPSRLPSPHLPFSATASKTVLPSPPPMSSSRLPLKLHPCLPTKTAVISPPPTPPPRQPCASSKSTPTFRLPLRPSVDRQCPWSKTASEWPLLLSPASPSRLPPPLQPCAPTKTAVPSPPLTPPPRQPCASSKLTPTFRLPLRPSVDRPCPWSKTASAWPLMQSPASPSRLPPPLHSCPLVLGRFYSTVAAGDVHEGAKQSYSPHRPLQTIVHKESRLLQGEINPICEFCIDGGSFHLNFDPRDYLRFNPVIDLVHVPETSPEEFVYKAADNGLILMRSLPDFLNTLHESGCCISPFTPLTLESIAISSEGKIRIRLDHIKFLPLGNSEGGSVMADYRNCAAVLEQLLTFSHGPAIMQYLQADLMEWFDIMRNSMGTNGYLIRHHSSLLPLDNRAAVFMKTYELVLKDLLLSSKVCSTVPSLYGVNMLHWHDIAKKSAGLKPWFDFNTYPRSGRGLIRLHRNCYCHPEMSLVDVNLLLHSLYPDLLSKMHLVLWALDLLKKLKLEENFKDRKNSSDQDN